MSTVLALLGHGGQVDRGGYRVARGGSLVPQRRP